MSAPNLNSRLIYWLPRPGLGWVAHKLLRVQGVQVSRKVRFGDGCVLARSGLGVVIDPETRIGDQVTIFHQVTIGRAHPEVADRPAAERVVIEDGVIIGAGAKVLARAGETLVLAEGTRVGANSVLNTSTGAGETWGGNPARRLSESRG